MVVVFPPPFGLLGVRSFSLAFVAIVDLRVSRLFCLGDFFDSCMALVLSLSLSAILLCPNEVRSIGFNLAVQIRTLPKLEKLDRWVNLGRHIYALQLDLEICPALSRFFCSPCPTRRAATFLFDASHAETAGNADWVIDEDASPQRIPTPDQSTVTGSTPENYWRGAISAWGIELVQRGHHVETLPSGVAITF